MYNTIWGSDYLLMDSNGLKGGSEYEKIIDMFIKIRVVEKPNALLTRFADFCNI